MSKVFFQSISVLSVLVLLAGCGVKAQSYIMVRDRVDQEKVGNGGFLSGQGEIKDPQRTTRKVYVLELTKPIPESEVKKIEQEVSSSTTQKVETTTSTSSSSYNEALPEDIVARQESSLVVDDDAVSAVSESQEGPTTATTYVVQKDDTLQKISKKFYNSYSKWTKIYEANKEKIKNPNLLKSGVELVIPAVE